VTVLGRDRKFALRPLILDVEAHFRAECGEDHDGASGIERAVAEAITKERSR
jgi:hypothetical protein